MFTADAFKVFWQSLVVMGEGMLGIFIFMAVIYGMIEALARLFPAKKEN